MSYRTSNLKTSQPFDKVRRSVYRENGIANKKQKRRVTYGRGFSFSVACSYRCRACTSFSHAPLLNTATIRDKTFEFMRILYKGKYGVTASAHLRIDSLLFIPSTDTYGRGSVVGSYCCRGYTSHSHASILSGCK